MSVSKTLYSPMDTNVGTDEKAYLARVGAEIGEKCPPNFAPQMMRCKGRKRLVR